MILIIPIFWILFSILTTIMAAKRNRSIFGWFLFSTFLSPITAWFFLLALGKLEVEKKPEYKAEYKETFSPKVSYEFGRSLARHRYAVVFSIIFLTLLIRWSFSH